MESAFGASASGIPASAFSRPFTAAEKVSVPNGPYPGFETFVEQLSVRLLQRRDGIIHCETQGHRGGIEFFLMAGHLFGEACQQPGFHTLEKERSTWATSFLDWDDAYRFPGHARHPGVLFGF